MLKMLLAAAAAVALATASPAVACPDCKNCPHKDTVAAADKAEKKDGGAKAACACSEAKDCKCAAGKCDCPACHAKKGEKKDEQKKS